MLWRRRKHEDFQAELEAHLQLEADELRAEGLSGADAHAASRRTLGNRTAAEERFFESRHWMFGQHLLRDLRFAMRVLRKEPKFSLLTILGLALGIAVSTALFAFVSASAHGRGTGFRPPDDVLHPDTYVSINRNDNFGDFSSREFRYLQEHAASITALTAESEPSSLVLGAPDASAEAEEVFARFESADFLAVRGFSASLGRSFSKEEESAPVAVLSHPFWERRFGGDAHIAGQTVLLNNHPATIIGVADPRFHPTDTADLFLPIDLKSLLPANAAFVLNTRLRPGAGLPQVRSEFQTLTASFADANPGASLPAGPPSQSAVRVSVFLGETPPEVTRQRNEAVFALDLGISMILLIACSNLASLLLARATVRRRELGVRLSLGASRARLVSQLLTESLLLSACGGLLGVLLSTWLAKWLLASLPGLYLPADHQTLLYGLLLALVTGVSFGLGPALAVTKTNLAQALHSGGAPGTEPPTLRVGSRRNLLVVVPLALSLMLLTGAAILIRTAESYGFLDTSFDSSRLIALAFRLKDQGYDDARAERFREQLRDRFRALPSVASAAIIDDSPFLAGSCQIHTAPPVATGYSVCHRVSPEFFDTTGLRILRGRPLTSADRAGSARVAIVSQSFADKFLAGQEPLGRRLETAAGSSVEVVGVAADILGGAGPLPAFPAVYIPSGQDAASQASPGRGSDRMEILVRATVNPLSVAAELRQITRAADPSLWINVQTFDDYLTRFNNNARVVLFVLGILGALVLLMAAAGIYALLAYSVSQRTREIGIRMALGARDGEILMLVMRRTLILIAWGIACGLLGALALGRILAALLLKTPPPDAVTCASVALALAATSILASYLPARRALRVNPVQALKCE